MQLSRVNSLRCDRLLAANKGAPIYIFRWICRRMNLMRPVISIRRPIRFIRRHINCIYTIAYKSLWANSLRVIKALKFFFFSFGVALFVLLPHRQESNIHKKDLNREIWKRKGDWLLFYCNSAKVHNNIILALTLQHIWQKTACASARTKKMFWFLDFWWMVATIFVYSI